MEQTLQHNFSMSLSHTMVFAVMVVLALLLHTSTSFRLPTTFLSSKHSSSSSSLMTSSSLSMKPFTSSSSKVTMRLWSGKADDDDLDSSEIETGSSSSTQVNINTNHLHMKSSLLNPSTSDVTSRNTASSSPSSNLSANKNSAFDAGLLVMFPIMIITLGLFFVFPVIAPYLASQLPPPMSY